MNVDFGWFTDSKLHESVETKIKLRNLDIPSDEIYSEIMSFGLLHISDAHITNMIKEIYEAFVELATDKKTKVHLLSGISYKESTANYSLIQKAVDPSKILSFADIKDYRAYTPVLDYDFACVSRTLQKLTDLPEDVFEVLISGGGIYLEEVMFILALDRSYNVNDPRTLSFQVQLMMFQVFKTLPDKRELIRNANNSRKKLRDTVYRTIIDYIKSTLKEGNSAAISVGYSGGGHHTMLMHKLVNTNIVLILDYQELKADVLDIDYFNKWKISEVVLIMNGKNSDEESSVPKVFWDIMRNKIY